MGLTPRAEALGYDYEALRADVMGLTPRAEALGYSYEALRADLMDPAPRPAATKLSGLFPCASLEGFVYVARRL
jgi:hypothetical protein